eukprot:52082-Chlamydomonas_euryale.AAC.1
MHTTAVSGMFVCAHMHGPGYVAGVGRHQQGCHTSVCELRLCLLSVLFFHHHARLRWQPGGCVCGITTLDGSASAS